MRQGLWQRFWQDARRRCLAGALGWAALGAATAAPPETHLALCGACHGRTGDSTQPEYPKLAGLDADYLKRQIADFRSGKRKSLVMAQIVTTLDADSLEAIVAFYAEQPATPGKVADANLVPKGKEIFDNGIVATAVPDCGSCHGSDGSGDAKYPRLQGQHAAYVEGQLLAFKKGERSNDSKGVMSEVAKRMTEAQIRAVAQYVARLKSE